MGRDLFISYSSDDRAAVDRLADGLRAAGWAPWVDHREIPGGAKWRTAIVEGLQSADAFLLVISASSVRSPNVVKELSLAEELGRPIVPIQLHPAEEGPDLKYQLAGLQRVSFVDAPFDVALSRLLAALEHVAGPVPDARPARRGGTLPGSPPPRAKRRSPWGWIALLVASAALAWGLKGADGPDEVPLDAPPAVPTVLEPAIAQEEPETPPVQVSISRLVIAHEVVDSEPRVRKRPFRAGNKVYAFTEVHADRATTITHTWRRGRKTVHTAELKVKPGRYRTWSYVTARDPGDWSVVVSGPGGGTLKRASFTVKKGAR